MSQGWLMPLGSCPAYKVACQLPLSVVKQQLHKSAVCQVLLLLQLVGGPYFWTHIITASAFDFDTGGSSSRSVDQVDRTNHPTTAAAGTCSSSSGSTELYTLVSCIQPPIQDEAGVTAETSRNRAAWAARPAAAAKAGPVWGEGAVQHWVQTLNPKSLRLLPLLM
jgi:hypothetical protein